MFVMTYLAQQAPPNLSSTNRFPSLTFNYTITFMQLYHSAAPHRTTRSSVYLWFVARGIGSVLAKSWGRGEGQQTLTKTVFLKCSSTVLVLFPAFSRKCTAPPLFIGTGVKNAPVSIVFKNNFLWTHTHTFLTNGLILKTTRK